MTIYGYPQLCHLVLALRHVTHHLLWDKGGAHVRDMGAHVRDMGVCEGYGCGIWVLM